MKAARARLAEAIGLAFGSLAEGRISIRGTPLGSLHGVAPNKFLMRTRLYAAAAQVNIHPTRSKPRNRVLRIKATVLNQPKISSTRWLFV